MSSQPARAAPRVSSPRSWLGSLRWRLLPRLASGTRPADFGALSLDPEYHEREWDQDVRTALAGAGPRAVVLVGPPGSGRRRVAYAAARAVLPGHRLFLGSTPERLSDFVANAPDGRPYLVWLDELCVSEGNTRASLIDEMLADSSGREVVLLGVADSRTYQDLVPCPSAEDPVWASRWRLARLLATHSVQVGRQSSAERLEPPAHSDPLLRAATDCLRMGIPVVSEDMLRDLFLEYLPGHPQGRGRAKAFAAALRAARRSTDGWSVLSSGGRGSGRTPRYRLGWWLRSRGTDQAVPPEAWRIAIAAAERNPSPADAYRLGQAAWDAGRYSDALAAFDLVVEVGTDRRAQPARLVMAREATYLAAVAQSAAGRPDRAMDRLRELLRQDTDHDGQPSAPSIDRVMTRLALAHARGGCGDLSGAVGDLTVLRTACAGQPSPPDADMWELARAEVDHALGHWKCLSGQVRPAIEILRDAAERHRGLVADPRTLPLALTGQLGVQYTLAYWAVTTGDAAATLRGFSALAQVCERDHGLAHPLGLRARVMLATLRGEHGSPEGAVEGLRTLLERCAQVWGPLGFPTLTIRGEHARWLVRAGETWSAIEEYERLVAEATPSLGEDHPWLLGIRESLAECLDGLPNRADEARRVFSEVLQRQLTVFGPRHPQTLRTRFLLARSLGRREPDRAFRELTSLVDDQVSVMGADHITVRETRHLRDVYEKACMVRIGRQPVYHRDGWVIGYELLFRDSNGAISATKRDASATSQVIVNAFTDFSFSDLPEGRLYFLNVTREFLIGSLPIPVAADRVVLEILGGLDLDEEVIDGMRRLAAQGYQLALDTTTWLPVHDRLLPHLRYVKVDLGRAARESAQEIARVCSEHPQIALIGQRIETSEHRELADELGCELLQGFALGRPQVVTGKVIPSSRLRHLQLVRRLMDPEGAEVEEISRIIMTDPGLTSRVLRMCNSAQSGLKERVSSVSQAVVLLGQERLRRWITLMDLSDLVEGDEWRLASMIDWIGLCQLVARRVGLAEDIAFLVGLISEIADMQQKPIEYVISDYPLKEELIADIISRQGKIGQVLTTVSAYKTGDAEQLLTCQIPSDDLVHMYLTAVKESDETTTLVMTGGQPGG